MEHSIIISQEGEEQQPQFNEDLIKKYPRSNRRLPLVVNQYGIGGANNEPSATTVHISPHGLEFRSAEDYEVGTLLKINIALPGYWSRKQKYVEYGRVDTPGDFRILAKVVSTQNIGKRGKKRMVIARTVNMDDVDAKVLKSFLQEG